MTEASDVPRIRAEAEAKAIGSKAFQRLKMLREARQPYVTPLTETVMNLRRRFRQADL
jgi:hypothetical protein